MIALLKNTFFSTAHKQTELNGYVLVSSLFIRILALIFFTAFFSLALQIEGLMGLHGILSVDNTVAQYFNSGGTDAWWKYPMLFWFNASNEALIITCYSGCILALLLFLNIFPRISLALLLVFYLSLFYAGQRFMWFQWDTLLIESGFLALFLNPRSKIPIFLLRWLLFRLRFLSGISKLATLDPAWSGLMAVVYYFEVQPLPNSIAWYAHQLPESILIAAAAITLFIEIFVPFMMFLPRRYRFIAAWLTIGLQLLIMLTSNHNWLNILTIALCLFLFDDKALKKVIPVRLQAWLLAPHSPAALLTPLHRIGLLGLSAFIFLISSVQIYEMVAFERLDGRLGELTRKVEAFRIVNQYHVFPTMPEKRFELLIYGSDDGQTWQQFRFKYYPDSPDKRPEAIIPHHPRLDWLMWFVPYNSKFLPFFENFLQSLLMGSPEVMSLLAHNPFTEKPPRYIRVDLYQFQLTSYEERKQSGHWWKMKYLGPFPPLPYLENYEN